jgi:hypothetical protein
MVSKLDQILHIIGLVYTIAGIEKVVVEGFEQQPMHYKMVVIDCKYHYISLLHHELRCSYHRTSITLLLEST